MPIAFGQQTIITIDGAVITKHQENITNYNTVKSITSFTESTKVSNAQQALAEFLKLMDRYSTGDIMSPGIQLLEDKLGNLDRVETSWIIPNLH